MYIISKLALERGRKRVIECAIETMVIAIEEANDEMSSKRWLRDILIPLRKNIGMTTRTVSEITSAGGFHWRAFMVGD